MQAHMILAVARKWTQHYGTKIRVERAVCATAGKQRQAWQPCRFLCVLVPATPGTLLAELVCARGANGYGSNTENNACGYG